MKNQTPAKEKAFKQISFSRDFVAEVNLQAEAADRSAAKHIEHCVRIAQAIEQILPSGAVQALKAGEMPASDLLAGLAAVLANPGQSTAIRGIMSANPARISQDPADPEVFIRRNADGSIERGQLDDRGGFVPGPVPKTMSKGTKDNGPPKEETERKGSKAAAEQPAAHRRARKVSAHA